MMNYQYLQKDMEIFLRKMATVVFQKNAVPPHVDHHADPTEHFKQVSTSSNFDTFMLTIEVLPS